MPGIVGIISLRQKMDCEGLVDAMVTSMRNESFYVSGKHFAPEMGIYAGWVAHPESQPANQVFLNETKDVALILAGECFVEPQIVNGLKLKGHSFGKIDGEGLVHLYEEKGDDFFNQLDGLFSGLLIDKRQGKAFLFNDRYGMERIYWWTNNEAFYFASEAKALLKILPKLRAFDEQGVAQFLSYGCTLGTRTLFRGIQTLPGASLWCFDNGKCYQAKYFSPETWETQPTISPKEYEAEFQDRFKTVLPRYFESGSRIGISLTGGLDSRIIMACRPQSDNLPVCYTFDGPTGETVDSRIGTRLAGSCGLPHHVLRLGPDFFSDFASQVDRTVCNTDGCLGMTGAHEIYFNALARDLAPTRLTGNYGGEILRGVSTFKPLGLSQSLFDPDFVAFVQPARDSFVKANHPATFSAFQEMPWNLFGRLAAARSQLPVRTPYVDNAIVALAYRVPLELRGSSKPAIDLINNAESKVASIPTDKNELGEASGLRKSMNRFLTKVARKLDYYSTDGLPSPLSPLDGAFTRFTTILRIAGTHKYLPYRRWLQSGLSEFLRDSLSNVRMPFFNTNFLQIMAHRHITGQKNYIGEIEAAITLATIERLLFRPTKRS